MTAITLRRAEKRDASVFLALVRALAEHEGQADKLAIDEAVVLRDGLGVDGRFGAVLAEREGVAVGFASYTVGYSIWAGGDFLAVDDVFVIEACRGAGVGEQLMRAMADECRARGCAYARWTVEPDNAAAIGFYRKLGAVVRTKGNCWWLPQDMPAAT